MMKAIFLMTVSLLYSLLSIAQPTVTDIINESKSFLESTSPRPLQTSGKSIDISISIIASGVGVGYTADNPVYSTNFPLVSDSLTSNPHLTIPPQTKGVKIKHLGGRGRLITTEPHCDKSDYWFRLIFPIEVTNTSSNRILLFYKDRSEPYILPVSNSLSVTAGDVYDYGAGILPVKTYFIHGLIEVRPGFKYFVTMKISQRYIGIPG